MEVPLDEVMTVKVGVCRTMNSEKIAFTGNDRSRCVGNDALTPQKGRRAKAQHEMRTPRASSCPPFQLARSVDARDRTEQQMDWNKRW